MQNKKPDSGFNELFGAAMFFFYLGLAGVLLVAFAIFGFTPVVTVILGAGGYKLVGDHFKNQDRIIAELRKRNS